MMVINLKKGYILIETLTSILIIAALLCITLDFYINQTIFLNRQSEKIDSNLNARIAIEFLTDKIKNAENIILAGESVYVDNKKIFLKDDVLIYDYSSVQIANKIKKFSVNYIGNGLYEITVDSLFSSNSVIVKNRW